MRRAWVFFAVLAVAVAPAGVAAAKPKKHRKVLVGAVAKVVETGTADYTGNDAWQADTGCQNADGTDVFVPEDEHLKLKLRWTTTFPRALVTGGEVAKVQTLTGTTKMSGSTYSYSSNGHSEGESGPCEQNKVTADCSGTLRTPGKQNAEMNVTFGSKLQLFSLAALTAKPASCVNSAGDNVADVERFTSAWTKGGGSSGNTEQLFSRGGGTLPFDLSFHRIKLLAQTGHATQSESGTSGGVIPDNCSSPDEPGVKADTCSQDYKATIAIKLTRTKRLYETT